MQKTPIEWCRDKDGTQGYTWNPITGCRFGCAFGCYAERMSNRFKGKSIRTKFIEDTEVEQIIRGKWKALNLIGEYPSFDVPTLWKARLNEPIGKKPRTIFVCSMAELFGDWIPQEWIELVLQTVRKCPQHTFIFLTKNPKRYFNFNFPDNCWLGTTVTDNKKSTYLDYHYAFPLDNCFISFEPLLDKIEKFNFRGIKWIIIGTLNRNGKPVKPENGGTQWEWINNIKGHAIKNEIPVFLKDSVCTAFPERFKIRRELPYLGE